MSKHGTLVKIVSKSWMLALMLAALRIRTILSYPRQDEAKKPAGERSHIDSEFAAAYTTDYQTPDDPTVVNPYKYKFILGVPRCENDTDLLIVVHSSPKPAYNQRRTLLRSTWLRKDLLEEMMDMKVRIIFFMGKSGNDQDQKLVEYESEQYGDIVQSDFIDSYQHNTYKAMSYLLWTSKYCSNASLLMKIDDDILLKTESYAPLRDSMKSWIRSKEPVYIGKFIESQVNRDPKSKWYISRDIWPEDKYPLWFQGLIYFLSPRSAADLFQAALQTVYMHTDDVFIGILVSKVPSIKKGIVIKNYLSAFALDNSKIEKSLAGFWVSGKIPFFHIPNSKIYCKWSHEDLRPKPSSWFHR